ncbi:hypothetical protein D9M68_395550 [compost metagenome]
MPEQRPPGPLGADEGILPAHRVEIAAPENSIVVLLADEGQHLDGQAAATEAGAGRQFLFTQPTGQVHQHAADRHQQLHWPGANRQGIQPRGQGGILIGEERYQQCALLQFHAQLFEEGPARLWIGLEGPASFQQRGFTQQTAGAFGKAGEIEDFLQAVGLEGRQPMAAGHPVLGAEVFQVQPARRVRPCSHGFQVLGRQLAGERLDHHIRHVHGLPVLAPVADFHAQLPLGFSLRIGLRTEWREYRRFIYPQAHRLPVLGHQLASQAPGDADVAKVIDDVAEDVPLHDQASREKTQFTEDARSRNKIEVFH